MQIIAACGHLVDGIERELKIGTSKMDGTPQKLFDVAKLNNIGRKVKVEPGARDNFIRKAGRPQKIIENAN